MDLNEYLDQLAEGGDMTADQRETLADVLGKNPKLAERAVGGFMRQSDYTRKTQDLARDRERATNELTDMNRQLAKNLKDLEQSKISAAQYRSRLESIQEEYGVDVSDVLSGNAPDRDVRPAAGNVDPGILSRLEAAERNAYQVNPRVSALLLDAQNVYQRTFGSLDGFSATNVLDYAQKHKIGLLGNPEDGSLGALERLYDVPKKRHELMVADIEAKAKTKAEADAQKRMDSLLAGKQTGENPAGSWANQNGSPVLSESFRKANSDRIIERAGDKETARGIVQSRSAAEQELNGGAQAFAKAYLERRSKGVDFGKVA